MRRLFFVNFTSLKAQGEWCISMPNENNLPVKAVLDPSGEWVLDVLAAPFDRRDSDQQTFDSATDFMLDDFHQPVILYHHGVMPGSKELQKKPEVIGKAQSVTVKSDGVHVRVILNKALEWAQRVWEAAKRGLAVASSDSISHWSRLDIGGGKLIMYEKNRAGRIAVWPLAGLSLWDRVEGNFQPASRYALALPAMKAIYREAGIRFPDVANDTDGVLLEADEAAKRARIVAIKTKSKQILAKSQKVGMK